MNGELLNTFIKKVPGATIEKVFDLGSELLIKINVQSDPYYFINKETKKVTGANFYKDMKKIEEAYTKGKEISIK